MRLLFHCGQDRSSDDRNLGDELLEDVENARVVHRYELTKVLINEDLVDGAALDVE